MGKSKWIVFKENTRYILNELISIIYQRFLLPSKVRAIRNKNIIDVCFVVEELSVWKTEELYKQMTNHQRFNPYIVVVPCVEVKDSEKRVIEYCKNSGYAFFYLNDDSSLYKRFKPDIIFYQKPYESCYPKNVRFYHNLRSVFCYVYYTFHTFNEEWPYKPVFFSWIWQHYFENEDCLEEVKKKMRNHCKNGVVTGVPMSDILMKKKSDISDPWNFKDNRKRIIYAPHHSGIRANDVLSYSTFLIYSDYMLELAIKYKDYAVFAFKPHPSLIYKLRELWGKDKADAYYEKWRNLPNCQLELDGYNELFLFSDALIHDCSSFTLEYYYSHKPMMYLEKDSDHSSNLLRYTRQAYELHYKGHSKVDIDVFINDVINGNDPLKDAREKYFIDNLKPPYDRKASENIILSILGEM